MALIERLGSQHSGAAVLAQLHRFNFDVPPPHIVGVHAVVLGAVGVGVDRLVEGQPQFGAAQRLHLGDLGLLHFKAHVHGGAALYGAAQLRDRQGKHLLPLAGQAVRHLGAQGQGLGKFCLLGLHLSGQILVAAGDDLAVRHLGHGFQPVGRGGADEGVHCHVQIALVGAHRAAQQGQVGHDLGGVGADERHLAGR